MINSPYAKPYTSFQTPPRECGDWKAFYMLNSVWQPPDEGCAEHASHKVVAKLEFRNKGNYGNHAVHKV